MLESSRYAVVGQGGSAPVYGHAFGLTTYERHQPEQTLLYQLVEAHYPALVDQLAQQGKSLPYHVHREFEAYLKCGRLEHGFLRMRCDTCHFERLVAFSCKKRGFCRGRPVPAAAGATAGAESSLLAGERHQALEVALIATDAKKLELEATAFEIRFKFSVDMRRQTCALKFQLVNQGGVVFLYKSKSMPINRGSPAFAW